MRLIMAVSGDGFVARDDQDTMAWTGATDKALFKLLTLTGSRILAASAKTARLMPKLKGREVLELSRNGLTLAQFAVRYPLGTLLGGQTLALAALEWRLLSEVILMRLAKTLGQGQPDLLSAELAKAWRCESVRLADVKTEVWQPLI